MRTLEEIAKQFQASADKGLTADQVSQSRRQLGSNRLTIFPGTSDS